MRNWYRYLGVLFLGFTTALVGTATAQKTGRTPETVPGKILVKYDKNASGRFKGRTVTAGLRAQEVLSEVNGFVSRKLDRTGIEVWNVGSETERALRLVKTIPGAVAIPNYKIQLPKTSRRSVSAPPALPVTPAQGSNNTDTYLSEQWAVFNENDADVDALEAWDLRREAIHGNGDTVYVVVMDTGVDKEHPDLIGNAVPNASGLNYDAVYDNSQPEDGDGHGTHVSGTIGAVGYNGIGVAGMSHTVKIIDVRVLDETGSGSAESMFAGMEYVSYLLYDEGLKIAAVNMSFGGYAPLIPEVVEFAREMERLATEQEMAGTVWVVAAGNDNLDLDNAGLFSWPNQIEAGNVLSVGATTEDETLSSFSNYGSYSVDISAPGSRIISTVPTFNDTENPYMEFSGTSMAAPHVTGSIALFSSEPVEEQKAKFVVNENNAGVSARAIGRVLASAEQFSVYENQIMNGARLNLLNGLTVDENNQDSIVFTPLVRFNASPLDDAVFGSGGIMNPTSTSFEVQKFQISGPDSAHFKLRTPVVNFEDGGFWVKTVQGGEVVGLSFEFNRMGDSTTVEFSAELEVTTSIGTYEIDLQAYAPQFPVVRLEPEETVISEPVTWGSETGATFAIHNDGKTGLDYEIGQALFFDFPDEEPADERINRKVKFQKKNSRKSAKVKANQKSRLTSVLKNVEKSVREKAFKTVAISKNRGKSIGKGSRFGNRMSEHTEETEFLAWSDSLNNPDSVAAYWTVEDFSEGEGGNWSLEEMEAGDYAFVFGDFDNGYQNNSAAIALSPVFDFSEIGPQGVGPANLYFNYAAMMEEIYDIFGVGVFIDGEFNSWIDATDYMLLNDGEWNMAMLPVFDLTGGSNVQFAFIALSDEDIVEGFGALFDNVALTLADVPFFASQYSGSVAPDQNDNINVTVRSGYLPEGFFALYTLVGSNALNGNLDAGLSAHITAFAVEMDVEMTVTPGFTDLGEVPRQSLVTTSYTLENTGSVPLNFQGITVLDGSLNEAKALTRPDARLKQKAISSVAASRLGKAKPAKKALTGRFAGIERMAASLNRIPKKAATMKKTAGKNYASRVFKPSKTAELPFEMLYFEDFESSNAFPEGWDIFDFSETGEGSVWHIATLNDTAENANDTAYADNVAYFGDEDLFEYEPNSSTAAMSPWFELPAAGPGTKLIYEMDYGVALEEGFDVFALVLHTINPETQEIEDLWVLGTSDDVFSDSDEMGYAAFDLTPFAGMDVFFGFYVDSDDLFSYGGFFFDNLMLHSVEVPVWTDPEFGSLDVEATQEVNLSINTGRLFPGYYAAITLYNYGNEFSFPRFESQVTAFAFRNKVPVAMDDTLAVQAGDIVPAFDMVFAMVQNDTDEDGDDLFVLHATDPVYGNWKFLTYDVPWFWEGPTHYVAPLNYDGWDRFEYLVTDGFDIDTAVVYLAVLAQPHFVTGAQQQFSVLEDTTLAISTMKMAAGVGGLDQDLSVWGRSDHNALSVIREEGRHSLRFLPHADFWGQVGVTLYVGHEGRPLDSMHVTVVVIPVNDRPEARFKSSMESGIVTFADESSDVRDPEGAIVNWIWDFGNGTTSDRQNPVASYTENGTYLVSLTVTDNGGATATYEEEIEVIVTDAETLPAPHAFALHQNYPNPFNPSTTLRFDLPQAAQVTLTVYNTLGQRVASLLQQSNLTAGRHGIQFDASGLASGLYVYRIEARTADGKTHSGFRKLTLLK